MSLNLIRRLIKGSALTAQEHDGNLDKLETAVLGKAAAGAIGSSGLTMATLRILGRTTTGAGAIETIEVIGATLANGVLTITNGGGGATDLGYDPATRLLTSSTGNDAEITLADGINPGLLSSPDYLKLLSLTFGVVPVSVRNNSGATIAKGVPVYVTGSSGTLPTIAPADASVEATAARTLGLTAASIPNNADGTVQAVGLLTGLNTATLQEGALIWLSETTGAMTTTRPVQPAHGVTLGYCIKQAAGTAGIVYIKVDNGLELEELHDVLLTAPGQVRFLRRDTDGLWKDVQIVATDISNSSASGRTVLTGTPEQGRTALQLGTAAQAATTDFATAAQGVLASTAVQPAALASGLAAKADLVGGVVPSSQIPAIAISDYLGSVSSQSAMLALGGQRGDWCIRTDGGSAGAWILSGEPSSLLANWVQIPMPPVPVQSVNGQVGVVTLGAGDVGAAPAAHTQTASTITGLAAVATSGAYGDLSGRFDPASPGAIGGTAAAAGTFTAGTFTQSILLPSAAPGTPAAGHLYRIADTLRYRDSVAVERLLLNAADNLANLANATTARNNIGATAAYRQCIDLTAVAGIYTIDVQTTAQQIIKLGTIAGNVTINLANGSTAIASSVVANIPAGTQWEAVIRYTWTSGAITFLAANTGISRLLQSPDLTSPVSGKIYEILLTHERGATVMGWRQVGGQP